MVTGYAPAGVLAPNETIKADVPEAFSVGGLKDALAPCGKPLAASVTVPLNPAALVTAKVKVAAPPGATVCEIGRALIGMFVGIAAKFAATVSGATITNVCGEDIPLAAPVNPANA
jgi:hypothetical protein